LTKSLVVASYKALAFPPFIQKIIDFAQRTLSTFSIWLKKPVALLSSLAFTLGNMAFIFAAIYMLTSGLHKDISYWLIAGLWSLTYFVTLVPISINGYGVQELSLSFLLAHVGGMDNVESLTVAVLIRILFICASLPGALFLPGIMEAMALSQQEGVQKK